jgi:hypothetical protein
VEVLSRMLNHDRIDAVELKWVDDVVCHVPHVVSLRGQDATQGRDQVRPRSPQRAVHLFRTG